MTTSKPFGTISFNTKSFLKQRLDEFIEKDIIDFYAFIEHLPEEDEKKKHIHLYVIPSTKTNTNSFLSQFDEKDKDNEKPLKCLPAVVSKFADWYMYSLHDEKYLLSKGQQRKLRYKKEDIVCSSKEFLDDCIHRIDKSGWVGTENIINSIKAGVPFSALVRSGQVPVQLISQYEKMYYLCRLDGVERNGRESHSPKRPHLVDIETGETYSSFAEFEKESGVTLNVTQGIIDD